MKSTAKGVLVLLLTLVAALAAIAGEVAPPTAADAAAFVDTAETALLDLWVQAERAAWVQANFITGDTEAIAAERYGALMAKTAELAKGAARFSSLELPYDLTRKLRLIK